MDRQQSHFSAILSRLRYIDRWALMRNARTENLSEHSLEVAMIAHLLCVIGNVRHARRLDANRAALVGMYHDVAEIITGDMPTPVKYANGHIRDAYRDVETAAEERLLDTLPADLRPTYVETLATGEGEADQYLARLVKAADKLSALIKCLEERAAGNTEFATAEAATRAKLDEMAAELPEVADFMEEFLPSYGSTLDQLL